MKYAIWTLTLIAVMIGCIATPVSQDGTNNREIQVDFLFEHEGCKVYRFRDGTFHYYVVCRGATQASTTSQIRMGKTIRPDEIPTSLQGYSQ